MDVARLAELLHETSEHHDHYEKTHAKHNWWDWYAPYLDARQRGSTPEQASEAAGLYMQSIGGATSG
ncbi:MAG TPA: bleomycin resistance protein [Solirubrobacteraceae bacterium]|jgi:hypothetical protein|nr:bleomycin resistance protein [Solirubrobacteraceae bacterium]